jgi:hypothetical protein
VWDTLQDGGRSHKAARPRCVWVVAVHASVRTSARLGTPEATARIGCAGWGSAAAAHPTRSVCVPAGKQCPCYCARQVHGEVSGEVCSAQLKRVQLCALALQAQMVSLPQRCGSLVAAARSAPPRGLSRLPWPGWGAAAAASLAEAPAHRAGTRLDSRVMRHRPESSLLHAVKPPPRLRHRACHASPTATQS